jgi:hypothetical protein
MREKPGQGGCADLVESLFKLINGYINGFPSQRKAIVPGKSIEVAKGFPWNSPRYVFCKSTYIAGCVRELDLLRYHL